MTSHTGRLYTLGASLLAFFLVWAVIAAHPWASANTTRDPRLVALAQREQGLRQEAGLVQQIVTRRFVDYRRRFAAYKAALARRQAQLAAAQLAAARAAAAPPSPSYSPSPSYAASPSVRVVTLPPLTITRTS
jgi:hypothetical protein